MYNFIHNVHVTTAWLIIADLSAIDPL